MKDDLLNFFPKLSKKTGNDLEEKKLTIFTAILSKDVENKDVVKYFETGEITSEFMDKISQLYDIVNRLINEYVNSLSSFNGVENFPPLQFCKDIFKNKKN
ncbi:hypothetical protein NGRA_2963 [Nosema granulosis]|uniref:Uncharacterized protein n=1 Tax=Nosema granulosis TaxID=83296 RepID=A0A9P6GVP2_9MICR|nr:hypothetical protein NGRA_2963 [Nosema granulosis]